ncbi:hypothetical protein IW150_006353, partial [Coemansia sp. RSA 2607]
MSSSTHNDIWDLDQDDFESERAIAAQSLRKLENAFSNAGYKYGIDASKVDHMQEGFDEGLELGIQRGKEIGVVLGALIAQREIRRKLGLPEENIDNLVMRLRSTKFKIALNGDSTKNVGSAANA